MSLDKLLPPLVLPFCVFGMGITSVMADAQNIVELCNKCSSRCVPGMCRWKATGASVALQSQGTEGKGDAYRALFGSGQSLIATGFSSF